MRISGQDGEGGPNPLPSQYPLDPSGKMSGLAYICVVLPNFIDKEAKFLNHIHSDTIESSVRCKGSAVTIKEQGHSLIQDFNRSP